MQTIKTIDGQAWMPVFTPVISSKAQADLCLHVCHADGNQALCELLPCRWNPDKTEGEDKPCIWVKIPKELPQ